MRERPTNIELDSERGPGGQKIPKKKETFLEFPVELEVRSEKEQKKAKESISRLIENTLEEAGMGSKTEAVKRDLEDRQFVATTVEHQITATLKLLEADEILYPEKFMTLIKADLNGQGVKYDERKLRDWTKKKLLEVAATYATLGKRDSANKLENLGRSL